jgi:hypothetical protein
MMLCAGELVLSLPIRRPGRVGSGISAALKLANYIMPIYHVPPDGPTRQFRAEECDLYTVQLTEAWAPRLTSRLLEKWIANSIILA